MTDSSRPNASAASAFDTYVKMLSRPGLQSVHHWKLPNDDSRFNEDLAVAEFEASADRAFEATIAAIDEIGSADAARKHTAKSS